MTKGQPKLLWQHDGIKVKFASPILHEGLLYVCDDAGKLYCFEADKGGEPLWSFEYGKNTKGSPVWADGKIYVSEVDSKFHILKPGKNGCKAWRNSSTSLKRRSRSRARPRSTTWSTSSGTSGRTPRPPGLWAWP